MNQQQNDQNTLLETQILENKALVDQIQESAETLSKPMSKDDFMKWLKQQ